MHQFILLRGVSTSSLQRRVQAEDWIPYTKKAQTYGTARTSGVKMKRSEDYNTI